MIRVPITPFVLRWARERSQRISHRLRTGTEIAC